MAATQKVKTIMGWASGSELLDDIARVVMPKIPKKDRPSVAKELIEIFEARDCDTLDEVRQRDIMEAFERMDPVKD